MTDDFHQPIAAAGTSTAPLALGAVSAAPELDDEQERVLSMRVAGGLYAAFIVGEVVAQIVDDNGPVSMALAWDVLTAGVLLSGHLKLRLVALARVFWLLLQSIAAAPHAGLWSLSIMGGVFFLMVLLLAGTPRVRRRRLALALGSTSAAFVILGVPLMALNAKPIVSDPLATIEDGIAHGGEADYFLRFPPSFLQRDPEAPLPENASFDIFAVDNAKEIFVTTFCFDLETVVDEAAWVAAVIADIQPPVVILKRTKPPGVGQRRIERLETAGEHTMLIDFNTRGDVGCVVFVNVPTRRLSHQRDRLTAILDSFRFTSDDDDELLPLRHGLAGRAAPWRYEPPHRFKQRPDGAWHQGPVPVDQWVIDPVLDEHLLTRCRRAAPGTAISGATFFDEAVANARTPDDDETLVREIIPTAENNGRGRATLESRDVIVFIDTAVMNDVGCSTEAIVARRHAASSLPELRRSLDTFRWDP